MLKDYGNLAVILVKRCLDGENTLLNDPIFKNQITIDINADDEEETIGAVSDFFDNIFRVAGD
jgi:hypothetical protein